MGMKLSLNYFYWKIFMQLYFVVYIVDMVKYYYITINITIQKWVTAEKDILYYLLNFLHLTCTCRILIEPAFIIMIDCEYGNVYTKS